MGSLTILDNGGIAIVCTSEIEKMARAAYEEIQLCCPDLSIDFHVILVKHFSRGEFLTQIQKNVRHKHVYLFFDFNGDAARKLYMLTVADDAIYRAGAKSITHVVPDIPFLRQDRKDRSRTPITGRLAIKDIEKSPITVRTITLDMHSPQCEMAFDKPFDHLPGFVIFVPWLREKFGHMLNDIVIVGPDSGAEKRVRGVAKRLDCDRAFFSKDRIDRGESDVGELYGANVEGKVCVINDDIVDTAGTVVNAANTLIQREGASAVYITGTHGVFGTKDGVTAYEKLESTGCEVVVTDSINTEARSWLTVLSLSRFMAHTILANVVVDGSVSKIITAGLPEDS